MKILNDVAIINKYIPKKGGIDGKKKLDINCMYKSDNEEHVWG